MQFNDTHKKEYTKNFPFGVTKVNIVNFTLAKTDNGKEYVEVAFVDHKNDELSDTARVWFTTDKAAQFSFNTLKDVFVHNAPEAKKDEARDMVMKTANTESLVELLKSKLLGKEMWVTKYFDANRTHDYQGQIFRDVNKNIYGYEPSLIPELMPNAQGDSQVVKDAEQVFNTTATDPTDNWGK